VCGGAEPGAGHGRRRTGQCASVRRRSCAASRPPVQPARRHTPPSTTAPPPAATRCADACAVAQSPALATGGGAPASVSLCGAAAAPPVAHQCSQCAVARRPAPQRPHPLRHGALTRVRWCRASDGRRRTGQCAESARFLGHCLEPRGTSQPARSSALGSDQRQGSARSKHLNLSLCDAAAAPPVAHWHPWPVPLGAPQ